jgi:two-component system nitrogen regulation response regulator GlnG
MEWSEALARTAQTRLARGDTGILNDLTSEFERTLIRVALAHTGGRKIEAATLLGWGRNTLTRKIQELGMEAGEE